MKLAQEAEVGCRAEVGEVGKDLADLAVGEAEPAGQGSGVLIDRGGGDEAAGADVVGLIGADDRVLAVHIVALDSAADDEVMAAPAVVGAIAVAREGASEVGGGEGGDAVAEARGLHEPVEILEGLAELGEELGVGDGLVVVGIEATQLDIEDLAIDAEAGASADDAGDGLKRGGEGIVGELVGGGVEILGRVGNAGGAGSEHGGGEERLGLHGAIDDDTIFFGEEVGFVCGEDGVEGVGAGR